MKEPISQCLDQWLAEWRLRIGQVALMKMGEGWELRHIDEVHAKDLACFQGPLMARLIANVDDQGKFRPLKTARNLRHGWRLELVGNDELRRALDYFYPGMLGLFRSQRVGDLKPVPLRETLERQTGMYRLVRQMIDEQAQTIVDTLCARCMKRRLWGGEEYEDRPGTVPLLCHEACNLFISEARKLIKGE